MNKNLMWPILFNDEIYKKCISLAENSKGKNERYGSIWTIDMEVKGEGFNCALSNPRWKHKLYRYEIQGYANHAEVEALNNGLMKVNRNLRGGDIYVAGFFKKTNQLFFQDKYTCIMCPPKLREYGVKNIIIPTLNGWKARPIEEALKEAYNFKKGGTTKNRLKHCQGNYTLSDFKNFENFIY